MAERKIKCKYCNYRGTKEQLVHHTDRVHQDMIPDGYTAARLVFNNINKKEHGTCVVCKCETEWNEKTWKYNRLCGRPECSEALRKKYQENMIRTHGTDNILNDPEQQEKMLKNRSISGKYKFRDGETREYVGSFEKKALEFFDKVLEVPSQDIITPGPTLEYMYRGEKHFWITDMLYLPYNLIIEVKDGGDNPNTRDMKSYREKQVAKERMITDMGTYNYIRLTNNQFDQLLLILAELKMQMIDEPELSKRESIIRINEEVGGMPPHRKFRRDDSYIVPYTMSNIFAGYEDTDGIGFMRDLDDDKILIVDEEGEIVPKDAKEFLSDKEYATYQITVSDIEKRYTQMLLDYKSKKKVNENYFYELFTGRELLTEDQLDYDDRLRRIDHYNDDYKIGIAEATVNQQFKDTIYIGVLEHSGFDYNIKLYRDIDGYFAMNEDAKVRSKSFKTIEEINPLIIDELKGGIR